MIASWWALVQKKQNKFLNMIVTAKNISQWNRKGSSVVGSIYFSREPETGFQYVYEMAQ